ncbi:PREDICTED: uncharacterized protein LOC105624075 [Atta cephalotes]|uniref:Uncharacterized protein n=1 Tax=Atta cephalotes TaxID=12957 RepID=A0A158NTH0_ATTCE|nr:PREDICTED: uncharacterized protein LOC105624075 [Atta cephalotes]
MKDLTDRLYVNWNALETSEEYNIMRKYAKNGRRYSLGYSLYCFVALYLFLSMSLIPQLLDVVLPLNKSRSILLTYPGYYFVDEREYFFYIFFHAIVAWEIAMTGIVAHDCIFVTYVEHVCSMFAVVGYAQLLEDTFNVSFAMQILIVTIGMSITLLQVVRRRRRVYYELLNIETSRAELKKRAEKSYRKNEKEESPVRQAQKFYKVAEVVISSK